MRALHAYPSQGTDLENAGVPTTLFEGKFVSGTVTLANYDVAEDGESFLMVQAEATAAPSMLLVTLSA